MKNILITRGMVFGILVLFIGAGFIPNISATIKSNADVNYNNSPLSDEPSVDIWQIVDTVGYWSFDEGQGDTAYDSSSYHNDGLCEYTEWASGHSNYALKFSDPDNSDVIVEDDASLNFNNLGEHEGFMIDFWMLKNQSASPGYLDGLVCKAAQWKGYYVYLSPEPYQDHIIFWIGNGQTGQGQLVISNTAISDQNWHHIVAIWGEGTLYLYIDNLTTPDSSAYVGNYTVASCTKSLDIGNYFRDNLHTFDGKIDEVRISKIVKDNVAPDCRIEKPRAGFLYIKELEICPTPFGNTIIIFPITIQIEATDVLSGVKEVRVIIDGKDYGLALWNPLTQYYEYLWDETSFGKHTLTCKATDNAGNTVILPNMTVWYFNIKI